MNLLIPSISMDCFSILADGLDHPEGVAVDRYGSIWCGGELGQVYCISPIGEIQQIAQLGGLNLGITLTPHKTVFACNPQRGALIEIEISGKELRSIEHVGNYRLRSPNFSVLDREGNLYFTDSGTFLKDDGFLFCLRPNGTVQTLLTGLGFPNGLALSADERMLYVALSNHDSILAVPLTAPAQAGQPHVFAQGLARVPDGAVLDAEGYLYVTCYASDCIYRISPQGETALFAYDPYATTLASPTNAAFGGPNGKTLYFANLSRWHICSVQVDVPGQPLAHQL